MIVYDRPIAFPDVDAAGILFFGRFLFYCHEAMERLFAGLPEGYVDLIQRRRVGFPAVNVTANFRAPLRFGDVTRIALTVPRVGTTSATLHYQFTRLADGADAATIDHVVVSTALDTLTKIPHPPDVRALFEAHAA